jgi:hypothetical protein
MHQRTFTKPFNRCGKFGADMVNIGVSGGRMTTTLCRRPNRQWAANRRRRISTEFVDNPVEKSLAKQAKCAHLLSFSVFA